MSQNPYKSSPGPPWDSKVAQAIPESCPKAKNVCSGHEDGLRCSKQITMRASQMFLRMQKKTRRASKGGIASESSSKHRGSGWKQVQGSAAWGVSHLNFNLYNVIYIDMFLICFDMTKQNAIQCYEILCNARAIHICMVTSQWVAQHITKAHTGSKVLSATWPVKHGRLLLSQVDLGSSKAKCYKCALESIGFAWHLGF